MLFNWLDNIFIKILSRLSIFIVFTKETNVSTWSCKVLENCSKNSSEIIIVYRTIIISILSYSFLLYKLIIATSEKQLSNILNTESSWLKSLKVNSKSISVLIFFKNIKTIIN